MKVIICEDDYLERGILKKLLLQLGEFEILEMENALGLSDILKSNPVDVVFLDIDMPGINGMEAAKAIREFDLDCTIIFVTAFEQFAREAFSVYALDYIIKPIRLERLQETLKRAVWRMKEHDGKGTLIVKNRQTLHKISQDEIIFIEKLRNKCLVYTKELVYETHSTMAKLEEILDKKKFVRTHNGFIVNKEQVKTIVPTNNLSYRIYFNDIENVAFVSRGRKHVLEDLK